MNRVEGRVLFTGWRSGEVVAALWRDVDLERALWAIRGTKNGEDYLRRYLGKLMLATYIRTGIMHD